MVKTAMVIGGSGGIGEAIVRRLVGDGFRVCLTYCRTQNRAEALVKELGADKVSAFLMDVVDESSVNAAFLEIERSFPTIDVLVYSVSFPLEIKRVVEKEWGSFLAHFEVQVKGLFLAVKKLLPQMKRKEKVKVIVVLTEMCFGAPPTQLSDYVTAKYALLGFSRSLAGELAKYDCTVNTVSPGLTPTSLSAVFPQKLFELEAEKRPSKRVGTPEDAADMVVRLIAQDASNVTGQDYFVNGVEDRRGN